jgi:hypothetical protein
MGKKCGNMHIFDDLSKASETPNEMQRAVEFPEDDSEV